MNNLQNIIKLTKDLVQIPSFVSSGKNERELGHYLFNYLKKLPWITVEKQYVENGRFNLIARDQYPTKFLVCGHMDTVESRAGWSFSPWGSTVIGNKLYGLGASDMKGSIASFLTALSGMKSTKGLLMLLYVDEEYDFKGMKAFIKEYKDLISPILILSLDGNDLTLGNGCRGVIEVCIDILGKTGHAANPLSGNNAITGSILAIQELSNELKQMYSSPELGKTTCNVAYIQGGLNKTEDSAEFSVGTQGNNIADIARVVLDIRPAVQSLSASTIRKMVLKTVQKYGLSLGKYSIRHNLQPWLTSKKKLKEVVTVTRGVSCTLAFANAGITGYIDMQMLWQAFDKPNCFLYGAGNSTVVHKPNEFVTLSNLSMSNKVYTKLIRHFGKG